MLGKWVLREWALMAVGARVPNICTPAQLSGWELYLILRMATWGVWKGSDVGGNGGTHLTMCIIPISLLKGYRIAH